MNLTESDLAKITQTVNGYKVRGLTMATVTGHLMNSRTALLASHITGEVERTDQPGRWQRTTWLPNGLHQLRPALHLDTTPLTR